MPSLVCFQDYFLILPKELVLKIMASLSLNDRLSLMQAYPKFQSLGQERSLETRVFTSSETSITNRNDLEKLLDPKGTHVEFSLNFSSSLVCDNPLTVNTLYLMPSLQSVTFKNCEFSIEVCQCSSVTMCSINCTMWNLLLSRVSTLNIDSCSYRTSADWKHSTCWLCWAAVLRGNLINPNRPMQEVELNDTLDSRGLQSFVHAMVNPTLLGLATTTIHVIAEDLATGKTLKIARIIHLPDGDDIESYQGWRVVQCGRALSNNAIRTTHERTWSLKFKSVQVKIHGTSDVVIKVTDQLDLAGCEAELHPLPIV